VFIELAGPGAERIAIRQDGVLLWRRRLLPIAIVAGVFPEERAIVLNLDRHKLSSTLTPPSTEEGAGDSGEWQERVGRYVSAGEDGLEQDAAGRDDAVGEPSTESAGPERRPTRHLLFVSTTHGYTLVEQEGPPPLFGQRIDVPAETRSFRVAKLGPSPLPNDWRICAYLEQIE
jgi:hypothetical protein